MPLRSLPERFTDFSVTDRPLAPLTTWGIGGVARFFLTPRGEAELAQAVSWLSREGERFDVLGGGSNLLVGDGILLTPILHTAGLNGIDAALQSDGISLACGAGVALREIFALALDNGWSGLECLAGIPGTVGGALVGNAGTKYGAIAGSVALVRTIGADGAARDWSGDDLTWGYRRSPFSHGAGVISEAVFSLRQSEKRTLLERIRETLEARKTQPCGVKTAGCVFKNPPGDSAGRLLELAGCKGLAVGGAVVSGRHANFFENAGGATAREMAELVRMCARRVYDAFGTRLELEIRTMGFEEPLPALK